MNRTNNKTCDERIREVFSYLTENKEVVFVKSISQIDRLNTNIQRMSYLYLMRSPTQSIQAFLKETRTGEEEDERRDFSTLETLYKTRIKSKHLSVPHTRCLMSLEENKASSQ